MNLPVQSPQFTCGKTGAQKGKWLGRGHGAKDGEMELDLCLRLPDWWTLSFPHLHTPHCSVQNSNQQSDSTVWEPAWQSGRGKGIPPRERGLESSTPKDIKQKGRLDQKAKALPECHGCYKLSSQTCQTCYNYPTC